MNFKLNKMKGLILSLLLSYILSMGIFVLFLFSLIEHIGDVSIFIAAMAAVFTIFFTDRIIRYEE
jgi:hypothetical protein